MEKNDLVEILTVINILYVRQKEKTILVCYFHELQIGRK